MSGRKNRKPQWQMKQYVTTVISKGEPHDDIDLHVIAADLARGKPFVGGTEALEAKVITPKFALEYLLHLGCDPTILGLELPANPAQPDDKEILAVILDYMPEA